MDPALNAGAWVTRRCWCVSWKLFKKGLMGFNVSDLNTIQKVADIAQLPEYRLV